MHLKKWANKSHASKTKSALIENVEFGTSFVTILLFSNLCSTFTATNSVTLPFLPLNSLVRIPHCLSQPSSWELDVLNFKGQFGHVVSLFSCSGGVLSNSSWVTVFAFCY